MGAGEPVGSRSVLQRREAGFQRGCVPQGGSHFLPVSSASSCTLWQKSLQINYMLLSPGIGTFFPFAPLIAKLFHHHRRKNCIYKLTFSLIAGECVPSAEGQRRREEEKAPTSLGCSPLPISGCTRPHVPGTAANPLGCTWAVVMWGWPLK